MTPVERLLLRATAAAVARLLDEGLIDARIHSATIRTLLLASEGQRVIDLRADSEPKVKNG